MIYEEICTVYLHLKKKLASGCLTFTEQLTGVVVSHTTALTPIHAPVLCKLPSTCISKHHPYIDITSCFVIESFLFGQHGIHLLSHYVRIPIIDACEPMLQKQSRTKDDLVFYMQMV